MMMMMIKVKTTKKTKQKCNLIYDFYFIFLFFHNKYDLREAKAAATTSIWHRNMNDSEIMAFYHNKTIKVCQMETQTTRGKRKMSGNLIWMYLSMQKRFTHNYFEMIKVSL